MRNEKGQYIKGFNNQTGRKRSPEARLKMRLAKLGKYGADSNNWRGGSYPLNMLIRRSQKYRQWREDVFKRDGFACVQCGDNVGGNLEADHIEAFSFIMRKHGIDSVQAALICADLWDIKNGRTLCISCHKKTENYGGKAFNPFILFEQTSNALVVGAEVCSEGVNNLNLYANS